MTQFQRNLRSRHRWKEYHSAMQQNCRKDPSRQRNFHLQGLTAESLYYIGQLSCHTLYGTTRSLRPRVIHLLTRLHCLNYHATSQHGSIVYRVAMPSFTTLRRNIVQLLIRRRKLNSSRYFVHSTNDQQHTDPSSNKPSRKVVQLLHGLQCLHFPCDVVTSFTTLHHIIV